MEDLSKKSKALISSLTCLPIIVLHVLSYKIIWIKYLYIAIGPFLIYKIISDKKGKSIGFKWHEILFFTLIIIPFILLINDTKYIEIFIWYLTLSTSGVAVSLYLNEENIANKYLKIWNWISILGPFIIILFIENI